MATAVCTEDEAFERLRFASRRTNQKLRRIADDVIAAGRLD